MNFIGKMKNGLSKIVEEALAEEAKSTAIKTEEVTVLNTDVVKPPVYGKFSTLENVKPIKDTKREKKKVVGFALSKSKQEECKKGDFMPCDNCAISRVCSKAYSINMPSTDNMFKVEVVCYMQVQKESEDENNIYLKQEKRNMNVVACNMPCDTCGISDICSKKGTLKVPKHDAEIFSIDIKCTRFVQTECSESTKIETLTLGDI